MLTWRIERLPRGCWKEKKALAHVALAGTAEGAWDSRWRQTFHRSIDLCLVSMILELFFQIGAAIMVWKRFSAATRGQLEKRGRQRERQEMSLTFIRGHKKVALIPC